MATSKVRAAITIANISPRDMPLLLCSWFSELSCLSNWGNMARIANSLVGDMTAWLSDVANGRITLERGSLPTPEALLEYCKDLRISLDSGNQR